MSLFNKILNVRTNIEKQPTQTVDTINNNVINVRIDRNNIKNIPSAKYLIDTCMSLVSAMPLKVQMMNEEGIQTIQHDIDYLLNKENHFLSTSCQLKRNLVYDYLVEGNAYALVNRKGNTIESIEYIKPSTIMFEKVYNSNNQVIDVKVTIQDDRRKLNPEFTDIIIIGNQLDDYFKGMGLIHECNELLEQSLHMDRANISSLVSNINLNGILAFGSNGMKREVFENLKKDFLNRHQGYKSSNVLLLNGMDSVKFIPTNAINQKDSQLIEQKKLLNDLLLQSFGINNIGDMNNLYKNVLLGIIENFEQAFSKILLLESEKQKGYYVTFDTTEVLRGNFKEHSEIVLKLFEKGLITNNESRELLGFNRAEGKAYNLQSLGHIYKYEDDSVYVPNMNVKNKLEIIIGVITSLIFYIISVIIPVKYVKMRVDVPVGMIVMMIILIIIYIKYSEGKKIVKLKKKVDYFKSNIIKLQNKKKIDVLSEYTEENYNLDSHGLYEKSILFGWSYTEDYEIKDIYTIDSQINNEQLSPVYNRYCISIPIREYNQINNVFEYNGASQDFFVEEYDVIKMCAIANIECKVNKLKQQCNESIIHKELANINI